MSTYVLNRRQLVAADLATVFAFFKNPANLAEITPPWLNFRVDGASDSEVREGTRIRYTLRWWVFPIRWESLIRQYSADAAFADEMIRGPYKRWYHTHTFRAVNEGVIMDDRVEYELPFGPLGRLAHFLIVRRQLSSIFDYRARRIAEIFER